jgi:hypothetical protein
LQLNLILVPPTFTVKPPPDSTSKQWELASNKNFVKILAAIFQTLYSAFELYSSRGHQLEKYGYAAYALTVLSYVMMSLINLVAALFQPQYPSKFIVTYAGKGNESEVTKERRDAGEVKESNVTEEPRVAMACGAVGYAHGDLNTGKTTLTFVSNLSSLHADRATIDLF